VGRRSELEAIERFLGREQPGVALLEGEVGTGKTTLWRAAIGIAEERGYRVLRCAPTEQEIELPYAALADLIGRDAERSLPKLSEPRRRALAAALALAEPRDAPPGGAAIELAALEVLRLIAATNRLAIAVDDVQWLDAGSRRVLDFAVRRLLEEGVAVILARRASRQERLPLRLSEGAHRIERLRVKPLEIDELGDLLHARSGTRVPRPLLAQLHGVSGGNPFFALELARALANLDNTPEPGEPLPFPQSLDTLIERRLVGIAPALIDALGIVALAGTPTLPVLRRALGDGVGDVLKEAEASALLEVVGVHVRFTHPLLAAAVTAALPGMRRAELHLRLADAIEGRQDRARHLALGTSRTDGAVADEIDAAAAIARARGASDLAGELLGHASRLTPAEDREVRARRALDAARCWYEAGDVQRGRQLALDVLAVDGLEGDPRALALTLVAWAAYREDGVLDSLEHLERALAVATSEAMRARIETQLSIELLQRGQLNRAAAHASSAAGLAQATDDTGLQLRALGHVAQVDLALGRGTRWDIVERTSMLEPEQADPSLWLSIRFESATLRKWSDDFGVAKTELDELCAWALDHGFMSILPALYFQLGELEFWLGNWDGADRHARALHRAVRDAGGPQMDAYGVYLDALVAGHRGELEAARTLTTQGMELVSANGDERLVIRFHALGGFLCLSADDAEAAHRSLARAAELYGEQGYRDPGIVRYHGDEVESLLALGMLSEAEGRTAELEATAERLDRPSALATSARCRALILAAEGDTSAAGDAIAQALVHHERLAQPFEYARTLLVQGGVLRRQRKKREAREALERAAEVFDRLGASLWSQKARAEVARIGGRAPGPRGLTPTEREIVGLVVAGCTNREIGDRLFMSVKTVERHLTHIYAKRSVHSRRELVRLERTAS
jgi:DNA-binding CsgD family transcriptional regulator